jgi:carbon-monoxide dehydrogenase large subunit
VFEDGIFRLVGGNAFIGLQELAGQNPGALDNNTFIAADLATFPNGVHACEVEIDPMTGAARITRYCVVDDFGTVINPMLLKGQIHGGVVQGAGQALMEDIVYEAGTGQQLTASFMDYAMPRADDFPDFTVESMPTPTKANAIGAKGAGEAGTVGALPAVISAICDALSPYGIHHIEMPATPMRVWQALKDAGAYD